MRRVQLTPVEIIFLECLQKGMTEKDMVRDVPLFASYGYSRSTNSVRVSLYQKIGVHSASQALLWAIKHRAIEVKRVPAERANLQRRIFITE